MKDPDLRMSDNLEEQMSCSPPRCAALLCLTCFALSAAAFAQTIPEGSGPFSALLISDPRLRPSPLTEPLERARPGLAAEVTAGWAAFQAGAPGWRAFVDRRSGRIEIVEGGGLVWISGPANLDSLEKRARAFLPRIAPLLGIGPATLILHRGRSGRPGGRDTRQPAGPSGGPALAPGAARTFALIGTCGIPATARALAVNLTVVQPAAAGYLQVTPGTLPGTAASALTFQAGQVRSNNMVLTLDYDGAGTATVTAGTPGAVHLVVDVTGYFE